jgi:hypothetical protein
LLLAVTRHICREAKAKSEGFSESVGERERGELGQCRSHGDSIGSGPHRNLLEKVRR